MTHRRKEFLVYPPWYDPYDPHRSYAKTDTPGKPEAHHYRVFKSKRKAFRQARKWGMRSEVAESIHVHPKRHTSWQSSRTGRVWELK